MKINKLFLPIIILSILMTITLVVFSASSSNLPKSFNSNGDLIKGWYWLRDSALHNYAEWTFDNIPLGSGEITVQINALATDQPSGGGGFDAKFLLYYSLRGEGDIPGMIILPQTVTLKNVSSSDDPLGYNCQGQVTIPASIGPEGSRISLRIRRNSAQDNHVAFKKDSLVLLTGVMPSFNGDHLPDTDELDEAILIQPGTYTGSLGEEDEEGHRDNRDYYSIDLEEGQLITLRLTVPENAIYRIKLSFPKKLYGCSSDRDDQGNIKILKYVVGKPGTGTWYINVYRSSGEGYYQLSVDTSALSNQGRTLTSNLSIFVKEDEVGNLEIDSDGDGIRQEWEDMAMERINPYIELDEEEPWLDNKDNDFVANFVRIHPYTPNYNYQNYHVNQLPKYIIFRYVVTWSEDYGRFGFTAHEGDHERIYMAWRVIDNHTLDLDWVFTSAHRDPDIHHSVWSPYYRVCNKVDVATITENYDFSMLMCGELDFDSQDGRLTFCAAEGKHALYPTCNVCEDVLLVSTTLTGEDCCEGGRYLFDCYNVGEPDEWQYQDNEIYDLTVDEGKLGGEFPQKDTNIFYNKLTSRYRITIKTGNKDYAGTDAKINIKLHGQDENSSNWFTIYSIAFPPRSAEHVGIFEEGHLDHVFVSCTDLGSVNKIQVKHDNGGVGPGWYISEIWVEDLDTKTIWHCQPNTWLEKVFSPSLYSMGVWKDKTNKTFDLELEQ